MERLDFSSVMKILRHYISENRDIGQVDFLYSLFDDCFRDKDMEPFALDNGLVCRWMNGQAKVSPQITGFYLSNNMNRQLFAENFRKNILPLIYDAGLVLSELHALLIQDGSISEMQRMKLDKGYPCGTDDAQAAYIADILLFGMERSFVKRDAKTKELLTAGNLSPAILDYIYENDVPRPCRYFCGRDKELETLHERISSESKLFLSGIAGIGKSELAKAYAKKYKKEYMNTLYLIYNGNLKQDIADMDFADDLPEDSENERFRKHNRFLRSLKEDTLLIIDNFNTTPAKETLLSVVLNYKCRILFTTRSRIEGQPCMIIEEIDDRNTLLELAAQFYADAEKHRHVMEQIIEAVHAHTFAVELSARLLQCGILEPEALLDKLREEKTGMSASDQIGATKDGENRKATYYGHIHTLFSLYCLNKEQTEIMRCLSLIPLTGIPAKLFAVWMRQPDMNLINDLTEMGFIQPKESRMITLHPMLQEITVTDTKPSVTNCRTMLDYQRKEIFGHPGIDVPYFKVLFATVLNIIRLIEADDPDNYLTYLEDAFDYMEKYHFEEGMRQVIIQMDILLRYHSAGKAKDRVLLLDYQSAVAQQFDHDIQKAIDLEEKAVSLLPEPDTDTALLISNIYANLGGLYHDTCRNELAAEYMEKGFRVMEDHNLFNIDTGVVQAANYAIVLCDLGEPERALENLDKCATIVKKCYSDRTSDYALIQEAMGNVHLACGNLDKCREHLKAAMDIYEEVWADDPQLIEDKYKDILVRYASVGINMGKIRKNLMQKK